LNKKSEIRKQIQLLKKQYNAEELKEMSRNAIQRIEAHPSFLSAKTVLLYSSLADEVDTKSLISKYAAKKTILLPTVVGDDLELHVYHAESETKKGVFGIEESEGPLFTDYATIDLAVIPGMAFDRNGNRLGRGKGYYDRLLPQLNGKKIGVCFSFQLLDSIPCEKHDIPMDEIITT
jgi:5-formyltetrahydrofolate cyclo-ligase